MATSNHTPDTVVLFEGALANFTPHAAMSVDFRNPDRAPLLFPGRSHFTIGEAGWEEVADYALDWAIENARAAAPA